VSGYDDLGRLVNANCGSAWSQSFGYDQFGNISKTGSLNWACMTCYTGNNQYNTVLSASILYDADGNLLNDTFHTYTWDAYGHPSTIDSTTCGSNGTCLTYDALGRMVEKSVNNIYTEVLYSPVGKTAVMSGQTSSGAYFPLPGGAIFNQLGTGSRYFWHKDWLGSVRFASSIGNRASYFDRAFAPFGETYNNFGATTGNSFTGDTQDTISGTYDTPNRELNPSQGRWISPDPAGLGAVDLGNPQTWNRYAYVTNNPTSYRDPLGLVRTPNASDYFGGGGGGFNCTQDGVDQSCASVYSVLQGGGAAQCPNNNCGIGTATPYQCLDAVCGYMSYQYAATHANEVNGQLLTDSQYNAYMVATHPDQVAGQYNRLSGNAADVFGNGYSVDPTTCNLIGGHCNFSFSCDSWDNCGPGRYDDGLHVECAGGGYNCTSGQLWIHDDTVSPWVGSFSPGDLFTGNFWEHGIVDLVGGTYFVGVFSQ